MSRRGIARHNPKRDANKPNKVCAACGRAFLVRPSRVAKVTYCSKACMAADYRVRMQGDGNPHFSQASSRVCSHCKGEYSSYVKGRMFCSARCYWQARPRKNKPAKMTPAERFRSARIAKSRVCLGCGRLSGKFHWCMPCRLHGKHLVHPKSVCAMCAAVVPVRARKYCDSCWKEWMRASRGTPRRVDANHAEIVAALRKCGCSVLDLSHVGRGCPDILVSRNSQHMCLMEIKSGRGKLNKRQQEWIAEWSGPKIHVVYSVQEALEAVGILHTNASAQLLALEAGTPR